MFIRLSLMMFFSAITVFSQVPQIEPGVSKSLAEWRAARYSDVRYKLNLTLEKMSPVLKGTIEISLKVGEKGSGGARETGTRVSEPGAVATGLLPPIILDWRKIRGSESLSTISNVSINGSVVKNPVATAPGSDSEHLIFREGVKPGENVIRLDFTSPILTSGSAITRYVDKEDGAEYIYSLFVPSDASTAFPVFDQPDLKARFDFRVQAPEDWVVVSNASTELITSPTKSNRDSNSERNFANWSFEMTKPISTYVFAFAAGPWEQVSVPAVVGGVSNPIGAGASPPSGLQVAGSTSSDRGHSGPGLSQSNPITDSQEGGLAPALNAPISSDPGTTGSVFVRKSQAAKFKPHAAEVFRLNREGIKYLETYFDYKFPFPKYDIVLIPEFPFGGMEHAGATFLREDRVIFPQEPTKGDYISRANLIFHETAHQWFGDTVTMKWFDDLWLKEGFAEFMTYKTLEKVMPEANAWKVFYERNKQAAYLTDSTKGTTPIFQEITNLSAAKSAYGNIVYRKAPSFLRQAEFYLGEDKFQTAVRAFLRKHEFANAGWEDMVKEFEGQKVTDARRVLKDVGDFADIWVTRRGMKRIRISFGWDGSPRDMPYRLLQSSTTDFPGMDRLSMEFECLVIYADGTRGVEKVDLQWPISSIDIEHALKKRPLAIIPNYGDYGYGIFLLDDKSRDYVLKNIQNEKDPFLRSMMWGSLWDSVREGELDPKEYVELVVRNLSSPPCLGGVPEGRGGSSEKSSSASPCGQGSVSRTTTPSVETAATPPKQGGEPDAQARASGAPAAASASGEGIRAIANHGTPESDESTIATLLGRVSTAMNYYIPAPSIALAKPLRSEMLRRGPRNARASASGADRADLQTRVEAVLIERMQNAPALGQRITFYRAFLNIASTEKARLRLLEIFDLKFEIRDH